MCAVALSLTRCCSSQPAACSLACRPSLMCAFPHTLQVYGVLLFEQGRQAEARSVLAQGVSQNPANPQLCMEWALAEQAAGNLGALAPEGRGQARAAGAWLEPVGVCECECGASFVPNRRVGIDTCGAFLPRHLASCRRRAADI